MSNATAKKVPLITLERAIQVFDRNDEAYPVVNLNCISAKYSCFNSNSNRSKLKGEGPTMPYTKNSICDAGAQRLGAVMAKNTTVSELRLRYNKLGNDGLTSIAHALKNNTTLTFINFEGNLFNGNALNLVSSFFFCVILFPF